MISDLLAPLRIIDAPCSESVAVRLLDLDRPRVVLYGLLVSSLDIPTVPSAVVGIIVSGAEFKSQLSLPRTSPRP